MCSTDQVEEAAGEGRPGGSRGTGTWQEGRRAGGAGGRGGASFSINFQDHRKQHQMDPGVSQVTGSRGFTLGITGSWIQDHYR